MDKRIMDCVNKHYEKCCKRYGEESIMAVVACGSMNYDLFSDKSDVDTKAIYIPNIRDIVTRRDVASEFTIADKTGKSICNIHDIRSYVRYLFKGNMNFLETLFSSYVRVNPKYGAEWARLVSIRNDIAFSYPAHLIGGSYGCAMNCLGNVRSDVSHAGKSLYHVIRMCGIVQNYEMAAEAYDYSMLLHSWDKFIDRADMVMLKDGEFNEAIAKNKDVVNAILGDDLLSETAKVYNTLHNQDWYVGFNNAKTRPGSWDVSYEIMEDAIRKNI